MSRWRTILAIDHDAKACEVYRANIDCPNVVCGSVADLIGTLPGADVVIGGPPCVSFSMAGKRLGHDDGRDCIPDFVRAIGFVRPRMFLMENVPGLLAGYSIGYFQSVLRAFLAIGYMVDTRTLDAVHFGAPQFRERVWVVGMRRDIFDGKADQQMVSSEHTGSGASCVRTLQEGGIGGGGGQVRRHQSAEHVETPSASGSQDASPRTAGVHESLLAGRKQRRTQKEKAGAAPSAAGREDQEVEEAAVREVRSRLAFVGGPSRRLLEAVERSLALSDLPPQGALQVGFFPWPKPTHVWPWPDQPCMFGGDLLPAVVVGQALGLDGWWDAQNETEHGADTPIGTLQANTQAKGGGAGHYAIKRPRQTGAREVVGVNEPMQSLSSTRTFRIE